MEENKYKAYWKKMRERVEKMEPGAFGDKDICRLTKNFIHQIMDVVELEIDKEELKK